MKTETRIAWRIRDVLKPVRHSAKVCRDRLLRRLGFIGETWQEALPEELQFWERALSDPDRSWLRSEYDTRMNPELELQDCFKALIDAPPGAVVRILDVGAGPLTRLGKKWSGRTVRLFPVDPLAEQYKVLFARLNIRPPTITESGHGESLLDKYERNCFDLAYASNSLDHSYDPLLAIEQMFSVVKPQSHVYLWHFARVGLNEGYAGLHQWNFDIEHEEMILSNGRGIRHELGSIFKGRGKLECEREIFAGNQVVVGKLKKLTSS